MVYDDAGRVTQVTSLKSDNTEIADFQYTYDDAGNRISVVDAAGDRTSWTYDNTNQLLTEHRTGANAWRHTFTYDPVGNRTVKDEDGTITTSVYDAANRTTYSETVSGRTTFMFDADGNRTGEETPAGDLTTFTWDSQNRNTQVELPSTEIVTYVYNSDHLRVQLDDGTDVTNSLYDFKDLIIESDDSLTTQRRLIYVTQLHESSNSFR